VQVQEEDKEQEEDELGRQWLRQSPPIVSNKRVKSYGTPCQQWMPLHHHR